MTVNTIQIDLRANIGTQPYEFVNVLGFDAPGDGGGGNFYWDAVSTHQDDEFNVIQPNTVTGAGRWKRVPPKDARDNTGDLRICFAQGVASFSEFMDIRQAGFNCLLHYKYVSPASGLTWHELCNLAAAAGLQVIINLAATSTTAGITSTINDIDSHPAVAGYYLYDEPDVSNVSIGTQETKISLCRTLTNKPLFTSMTVENQLVPLVSTKFDVYLLSIYYIISNPFTAYDGQGDIARYNYNRMGTQSALYRELYSGKTIIPITTAFAGSDIGNATGLIEWQKKFHSYFGDHNAVAAFIWDTGANVTDSMNTNSTFLAYAKTINDIAIGGLKGYSPTFVYRTGRSSNLNVNELPNKGTDINYYSIVNAGVATDNRRQTFAEQGICVRNSGGIISYRCPDVSRIRVLGTYHNYADTTGASFQLLTSNADYYYFDANVNNVQVLDTATGVANLSSVELWGYGDLKSFGIQFTPASSHPLFFKFVKNAYIAGF